MTSLIARLALVALLVTPTMALADDVQVEGDSVTLAALLPALVGTEMGELVVARAPRAGESAWVRSSEVRAALKSAGRSDQGLSIPSRVRVKRVVRTMDADELRERILAALGEKLAPCSVLKVSQLGSLSSVARDATISVEAETPRNSGRVSFQASIGGEGDVTRVHGQAELTCPEPVVLPGASVRVVATIANVRVSAPGIANQPGRVGDAVRVTIATSKKSMLARVIDASTVEVQP